MKYDADEQKKSILDALCTKISAQLPKDKARLLSDFVHRFYAATALEDLQTHSIDDLYGTVLTLWSFAYERSPEEYKVHVYNPDYEQHGWQSTHTIVQAVIPDMPFIVDSARMAINRGGMTIHFSNHQGKLKFIRDTQNRITHLLARTDSTDLKEEAVLYFEIDRQTDDAIIQSLTKTLQEVLQDVHVCVQDWQAMRKKVTESIAQLTKSGEKFDPAELKETLHFLSWLEDHHFTFLGLCDFERSQSKDKNELVKKSETALGLMSHSSVSERLSVLTEEISALTCKEKLICMSKTDIESPVHRPDHMYYFFIHLLNDKGDIIGERVIVGLFTKEAYNTDPERIPFLRGKVAKIMELSGLYSRSHSGKNLMNILETLPRDDLFQASEEKLLALSMGIYHLQERRRIRLFVLEDVNGRFISCLVFVPRERFNTELRIAMQNILVDEFQGLESSFATYFSESVLARIHFLIRIDPKRKLHYNIKDIEQKLVDVARSWSDEFSTLVLDTFGEEQGNKILHRYMTAFPVSYTEYFPPRSAIYDIKHIESITPDQPLGMNLYRPVDEMNNHFRLKLYQMGETVPLSDVLPILENMGLRILNERPYALTFKDGSILSINDFGMLHQQDTHIDLEKIRDNVQECFANVWFGAAENDGFNELVFTAGLTWREITMLRAYAKYLRQIQFTFSQDYIEKTLSSNAVITRKLVDIFNLRMNLVREADEVHRIAQLTSEIIVDLDAVTSLDQDRILRRYLDLINATLRTNFFQDKNGKPKNYISIKFDPSKIPDMPLPRPMFEIFVYSPRFEGVHLRSGRVARGGLRWSDRREDFRTEVLGLMKAQSVKNAVIVPAGAKGGFFPKHLPVNSTREEIMAEGIACYQDFIRGLLDITDNLVNGNIVPPENVTAYDPPDHYLVVAADKGTATFSDIANKISDEYQFWLGDAFASGGSVGYDHKKMAITAKGAWESVKRHFYEMGRNTQTQDFTVVGIGDMAGDVFGNGMLLSEHIQLVAAFNHLHIFLDPNPDPKVSFAERKRLFDLPRSNWSDYNADLLSKGGGIFLRSAKSIKLTSEIKQRLNLEVDEIVPNDLLTAILKAPVDLLWNGGIGTFVKGHRETHVNVGDRANDAIRINAGELNCKVVGEGGNLGFTQQARVEYALKGGRINTDFIDNSAGVDCSDHEVNIKILLNDIVGKGDMTVKQRNKLLSEMTEEVAELVLDDNYHQTQTISLALSRAARDLELHSRYIEHLEKLGALDRALEFLPTEQALQKRKASGMGLMRPGISVLLAYTKNLLKKSILESDVPEDAYLAKVVKDAFPKVLSEQYGEQMKEHSLRREIIATQIANIMVNQMGFTFVYRLQDETGASISSIVRAYTVARNIFSLDATWKEIESLDNHIKADTQEKMMFQLTRQIRRATRWILRNRRGSYEIQALIDEFKPSIDNFRDNILSYLVNEDADTFNEVKRSWEAVGVPSHLAAIISGANSTVAALDIIDAAHQYQFDVDDVAKVYFAIGAELELGWIRMRVIGTTVETHWEALTREALRDDLDWQQRILAVSIMGHRTVNISKDNPLGTWKEQYRDLVSRWMLMLAELRASTTHTFIMFFVAIRELADLTQASYATSDQDLTKMCSAILTHSDEPTTVKSVAKPSASMKKKEKKM